MPEFPLEVALPLLLAIGTPAFAVTLFIVLVSRNIKPRRIRRVARLE